VCVSGGPHPVDPLSRYSYRQASSNETQLTADRAASEVKQQAVILEFPDIANYSIVSTFSKQTGFCRWTEFASSLRIEAKSTHDALTDPGMLLHVLE
jgi:hypothetical protein